MLVVSLPTYNLARISPPLQGVALWRPHRCSPAGCPARTRGMRPSVDSSMAPGRVALRAHVACTRIDTRIDTRNVACTRIDSARLLIPAWHRVTSWANQVPAAWALDAPARSPPAPASTRATWSRGDLDRGGCPRCATQVAVAAGFCLGNIVFGSV